ncbi:hypothetical protein BGC07_03120 [Piscirickettsia litoralis]|uniref:Uncharacterized protein n=2 Tax=Piscirickettsia litoralis TaxID=1891921 RepID=A0ABX2ZZT2_9GAMM|nr:hypothetical protein BGC07_03120 [Piscirickettsia litoralis]
MVKGQLIRPQKWLIGKTSDKCGDFSKADILKASGIDRYIEKYSRSCRAEIEKIDKKRFREKDDRSYLTKLFIGSYEETAKQSKNLQSKLDKIKEKSDEELNNSDRRSLKDYDRDIKNYNSFLKRNEDIYKSCKLSEEYLIPSGSEAERVAFSHLKKYARKDADSEVDKAYKKLVQDQEFQNWFKGKFAKEGVWASDTEINQLHKAVCGNRAEEIPFAYFREGYDYGLYDYDNNGDRIAKARGIFIIRKSGYERVKSGHLPLDHWMTLIPKDQFAPEKLQKDELTDFNKIYQAIIAGQDKRLRTNKGNRKDIAKINEYILENPKSKSTLALQLLKKHKEVGIDNQNKELMADIYKATRSVYKFSRSDATWVNNTSTLFEYVKNKDNKKSRSVAIYNALTPV